MLGEVDAAVLRGKGDGDAVGRARGDLDTMRLEVEGNGVVPLPLEVVVVRPAVVRQVRRKDQPVRLVVPATRAPRSLARESLASTSLHNAHRRDASAGCRARPARVRRRPLERLQWLPPRVAF